MNRHLKRIAAALLCCVITTSAAGCFEKDVMDELRQREWFSLFDGGIASCDVHLCKPEPEIFTTLMQTCHLAYDESIFVDDNKANAQAAYNLGITGILYKNPKSFTRALGACGIEVE